MLRSRLFASHNVAAHDFLVVVFIVATAAVFAKHARAEPERSTNTTEAGVRRSDAAARAFRAGHYEEALALYRELIMVTPHPVYLRNVGRCHQMLRQPEPAIDHFRRYIEAMPSMPATERAEIDVYIREMEALRTTLSQPPVAPPTPAPPVAVATPVRSVEPQPLSHKWWFWAGIGAVLTGVVVGLVAAKRGPPACLEGFRCQ